MAGHSVLSDIIHPFSNALAMSLTTISVDVNYSSQADLLEEFFNTYIEETDDDTSIDVDDATPKYLILFKKVADRETDQIVFELDDLLKFEQSKKSSGSRMVVDSITDNAYHYANLVCGIIDRLLPEPSESLRYTDEVIDTILYLRSERNRVIQEQNSQVSSDLPTSSQDPSQAPTQPALDEAALTRNTFPPELTRRYTLYFKPVSPGIRHHDSIKKTLAVRDVKSSHLGKLITVRGVVTRVSEVKPAIVVSAYSCETCGNEAFQEVVSKQYMPLQECPSDECKTNNNKGQLIQQTRASKFVSFQEVRIQELADQVPVGHIPRSLTVHIKGPLVRSVNPGDSVDISGIYMPRPYTGFRGLRAGLITDTYLDVQYVHSLKQQYELQLMELQKRPMIMQSVDALKGQGNVYEKLAASIAPEIYGHLDVKKALLLMLVGGAQKAVQDGMRIRGNINLCLMGDPGVAKSQLLKFIVKLSPRGVYTTGRGSSGVGLTAAVMRDPVTDEMILEGGALVLADNGVCCIDEFDKMDDSDRTAIHEVMEQQTISIAKAGMSTTLNARTSILAAANPVYGRYNPRLTAEQNINLPSALLSRFDLLFLILDKPNEESDKQLAEHVAYVHRYNRPPPTQETITPDILRYFVAEAKEYNPVLTPAVAEFIESSYVQMRQAQRNNQNPQQEFGTTTPRALLGIIRMTQALARINFRNEVTKEDVEEALRLIEVSKHSLNADVVTHTLSASNKILDLINDLFKSMGSNSVPMREVRERITAKGFTVDQLTETVNSYAASGLFMVTEDDTLELV